MRGHQPIKYTHTHSMTAILLRASRPEESGLRNSNPHCCVTNNLSQRVSGLLKWRARKSAQSRRNVILVIRCQNTPSKFQDGRRERERDLRCRFPLCGSVSDICDSLQHLERRDDDVDVVWTGASFLPFMERSASGGAIMSASVSSYFSTTGKKADTRTVR